MSISAEVHIRNRPWRGYDDPGLPSGMWYAWVGVTGDSSGGDRIARILFETEATPLTGRHYSIEQLESHDERDTSITVAMFLIGCSQFIDGSLANRQYTVALVSNENEDAALQTGQMLPRPIFLGQRDQVDAAMTAQFHNANSDGNTFFVRLEGYIWEARSIQAPGGLRRPADSLYG